MPQPRGILGAAGASVVVNYRSSRELADDVVRDVNAAGGRGLAIGADMGNEADIVRLFEETDRAFGPVTGLVNNAGVNGPALRGITEYTFKETMDILAVNTAGLLIACREAGEAHVDQARRQGWQHRQRVVHRRAHRQSRPLHPLCGIEGAVDTMTLGIATEVAREGIRVNAVRPGTVDTPIHDKVGQRDRVMANAREHAAGPRGDGRRRWRSPSCGCCPTRLRW